MKRILLLTIVLLLSFVLVACTTDEDPDIVIDDPVTFDVTFEANGGSMLGIVTVAGGDTVDLTELTVVRDGYTFVGWYTDEALTTEFDPTTIVLSSFTLYAKWEEVVVDDGNDLGPGIIDVLDELPTDDITITIWTVAGLNAMSLYMNVIEDFETIYPNITIEFQPRESAGSLMNDLEAAITYDLGLPTITIAETLAMMETMRIAELTDRSSFIPLEDFILDSTFGVDLEDFIPAFIEENQQYEDDMMYSFPLFKTTEVAYYNKTVFDAAGITIPTDRFISWEDLDTWAQTTDCEYFYSYDNPLRFLYTSTVMWNAPLASLNGDITINSYAALNMFNYMSARFDQNTFALPLNFNSTYSSDALEAGDVCMSVAPLATYKYIDLSGDEIGVAPIAQYYPQLPVASSFGSNGAISEEASQAEQLAAWLFITYLTSAEVQANWAVGMNTVPIHLDAYQSGVYKTLLDITDTSDPQYFQAEVHRAAFAQQDYFTYDMAFVGDADNPYNSDDFDINVEALIEGLASGLSITELIQQLMDEMGDFQ